MRSEGEACLAPTKARRRSHPLVSGGVAGRGFPRADTVTQREWESVEVSDFRIVYDPVFRLRGAHDTLQQLGIFRVVIRANSQTRSVLPQHSPGTPERMSLGPFDVHLHVIHAPKPEF